MLASIDECDTGRAGREVRAHRAVPAGRRCARRLSGGRVPGARRGGRASDLGCRHLDRRDQRRDHRGQSTRAAGRAFARVLADRVAGRAAFRRAGPATRFAGVVRRFLPARTPRSDRGCPGADPRAARVLRAAAAARLAPHGGHRGGDELLRHRAAPRDAGSPRRLRAAELRRRARDVRRGRGRDRELQVLRHRRGRGPADRRRARHGLGGAAARVRAGAGARQAVLGRRARFQHAARVRARRRAAPRHARLPGRPLERTG